MNLFLAALVALIAAPAMADSYLPQQIPDPRWTPGVVAEDGHDTAQVCGRVDGQTYSQRHRKTPAGLKALVMKRYGQQPGHAGDGEVDHRVPLALGGADAAYNLWWEPGDHHGVVWTYHLKDKLEVLAWNRVCGKRDLPLAEAQGWFMSPDWRPIYCREIGGEPCEALKAGQ